MGKKLELKIDDFRGGISNDLRSSDTRRYALTKHLDAFTFPHKLVPYFKTEAIEDKTFNIVKFAYVPSSNRLYGLGVNPAASPTVRLYYLSGTTWTAVTGGTASTSNRSENVLFHYKGFLYVWRDDVLMRYEIASETFTDNYQSLSWANNVATPVHHPNDDIAYFFRDNVVDKLDNTSFSSAVLTLPSNLVITSACPHGNYLAIACIDGPITNAKNSVVYLWDRDSSITTLSDRIDFGPGRIHHLANLNGRLTAVMDFNLSELYPRKVIIKQAVGPFGVTVNEIITNNSQGYVYSVTNGEGVASCNSVVSDDRLYFAAHLPTAGDTRLGIWVVDSEGRVSLDFIEEEATNTGGVAFQGIYKLDNTWWIAHSNDGSVNRTDDNAAYSITNPGIYESLILNFGDSSKKKKLLSVSVMTEPLPTSAGTTEIQIDYRKDEDINGGSYTTIFEELTDNSISHTAINIESTGVTLPTFKEIQFRVQMISGAVMTGLKVKVEEIDDDIIS